MSLGRYPSEVRAIADELSELLREEPLRTAAYRVVEAVGEDGLFGMPYDDALTAIRLLSQTPSQRDRTLGRLDDDAAAMLVLRARYLGLLSHGAFVIADGLADIRGSSYRSSAERGASLALSVPMAPSLEQVLPGWEGPAPDGEKDLPGHGYR